MTVLETNLPDIPLLHRGKVRDIYDLGDVLLVVATDRLSAFDVVLPTPIPDKGMILTRMSLFWFEFLKDIVPDHLVSADPDEYPASCKPYKGVLDGRSMLVKKATPLPVECIVRGYLSGSGWKDYCKTGAVCGISLPAGLRESEALPEPIFTPSTKAAVGAHDENIDFAKVQTLLGKERATAVRKASLELYKKAATYARQRGVIIADTKFEFGIVKDEITLIDEVLTPDSSRFWPASSYAPGGPQPSFDKQFVRDYLESIPWDKRPPGPELPVEIVEKTRERYLESLKLLTGEDLVT